MKRLLVFLIAVTGVLVGAVPAWAHVTVSSTDATQGGYAVLTFRVPNEEAGASTTKLVVHFPDATPIRSVLVQPHAGWTAKRVTSPGGAVTEIDWTADSPASGIAPGEFDEFRVSAGPLPKVKTLAFAAIQTYSDGTVVSWNETAAPGSAEPDHPKPMLTLAPAGTASSAPAAAGGNGPTVLAVVALVLAAAALGLAVVTRAAARRS
jgi:uncharacterized protein